MRFDKLPAMKTMGLLNKDMSGAVLREREDVEAILNGWRNNDRMVIRLGEEAAYVVPLNGAAEAMSRMDEKCPWLRPE